jgi:ferredoxin
MDTQSQEGGKTTSGLTIKLDRQLCIGAATCALLAPKTFALDEEGKVVMINGGENDDDDTVLLAAESCPVRAILVSKNGDPLYPK